MNYKLLSGDNQVSLNTGPLDASGALMVSIGDTIRSVQVNTVSSDHLRVHVDGVAHDFFTACTETGAWIWCNGRARFVRDTQATPRRRSRGPVEASAAVTPPTPAQVTRILVEPGERVEKGCALIVVSAMKMEITLSAPHSGMVIAVNTRVGAQVSPGEILVEVQAEPEENAT